MNDPLAKARRRAQKYMVGPLRVGLDPSVQRFYDGTLNANVGEVWETAGGRLWQIIEFNSIWENAPIVARNVTPGSVTADLPRGFDRYGKMVDGNAKLVRRVF